MKQAISQRSFTRSDTKQKVKPGQKLEGPDSYIIELSKLGLVREICPSAGPEEIKANPCEAAGAKSSASPAAPALQRKTAKPSKRGGPGGKIAG